MEEKPKRRSRTTAKSEEPGGNAKPTRKSRSRKAPSEVVVPALTMPVAPPALERLDSTVPLPPLRNGGTSPLDNGGITTLGTANLVVPRQIVCQGVEAAYLSDTGMLRENNEDSASAFLGTVPRLDGQEMLFGFLAVADGMGGHENGEVASNMAVRKITEGVLKRFYLPTVEGRQPGRDGESPLEVLSELILDVNQTILQEGYQQRTKMGTTLTCAILVGQTAFIGHVGDSRLYVLEKSSGLLRLVTHDHSVVQRLVDVGELTPQEAAISPHRSMLYMSIGQRGQVEPAVEVLGLRDVEYMLLCSDGLWEMLEDSQIQHILKSASGPAQASADLVAAANSAGGNDNVTVVVAHF